MMLPPTNRLGEIGTEPKRVFSVSASSSCSRRDAYHSNLVVMLWDTKLPIWYSIAGRRWRYLIMISMLCLTRSWSVMSHATLWSCEKALSKISSRKYKCRRLCNSSHPSYDIEQYSYYVSRIDRIIRNVLIVIQSKWQTKYSRASVNIVVKDLV